METAPALAGLLLVLRTVAAPALAVVFVWAATVRALPRLVAPAGALAGMLLGWTLGFGHQAAFPPVQTLDWLPWLLLALAVAAGLPKFSAPATAAALLAGLAALAPPLLADGEPAILAMETGAAALLGAFLTWAAGRGAPSGGAAALTAGLGSLGLVTTLGGSIVIGGLANSAFAVAAMLWVGVCTGRASVGPALLRAGAVVWLWLAFSARHLAEIPLPETLLAAAALATTALPPPDKASRGLRRLAVEVLPPALPALAAVGLAVWRYVAAQQGAYY